MTNTEIKDCTTCKYGFVDEQFGFPMCHHPKRFSEDCVDFNMHEEKEIKESEKPISPWKKIHTYTGEIHEGDVEKMLLEQSVGKGEKRTKIALPDRIIDTLEEKSEKPVPADLEELVCEELNKAAEQYAYNGTPDEWRSRLKPIADEIIKNFIAGAKWDRSQIMKEAVEVPLYLDGDFLTIDYNFKELGYKDGDKVRIIVCKKED